MSRSIDRILDGIDQGLYETSHGRHMQILRDISTMAIHKASDPNNDFDYHDAEETIQICEAWCELRPSETTQASQHFYD